MKKLFFLVLTAAIFLCSCGADQAIVDSMTNDMCKAMEKYDEKDPASIMSAATDMSTIAENEDYGSVSEAQLYDAMEEACPEGLKKLKKMGEE